MSGAPNPDKPTRAQLELEQRVAELRETVETRFSWLGKNHEKLERLVSELAADLARVDNKSGPAQGTAAQRLEALEAAHDELDKQVVTLYAAQQEQLAELARIRARARELVETLQENERREVGAGDRLAALVSLTRNDLHTGPADPK